MQRLLIMCYCWNIFSAPFFTISRFTVFFSGSPQLHVMHELIGLQPHEWLPLFPFFFPLFPLPFCLSFPFLPSLPSLSFVEPQFWTVIKKGKKVYYFLLINRFPQCSGDQQSIEKKNTSNLFILFKVLLFMMIFSKSRQKSESIGTYNNHLSRL